MNWIRGRFITPTGSYFEADLKLQVENQHDAAIAVRAMMRDEESVCIHDSSGSYVIHFCNIAFVTVRQSFVNYPVKFGAEEVAK